MSMPSEETATSSSVSEEEEGSLFQKLSLLETRIGQLSLTLALLQERERTVEQRLSTVETIVVLPSLSPQRQRTEGTPVEARPLIEAERRARSRALIEWSEQGTYVVCSLEGELSLVPGSRAWFDWLATISAFRFFGQNGRFTAYRETARGKSTRGWVAHRSHHGHFFKRWLGVTDSLTIPRLEQTAAYLQSRLPPL